MPQYRIWQMSSIVIYFVFEAGVIQATPPISANKLSNASPSINRGDIVFFDEHLIKIYQTIKCYQEGIYQGVHFTASTAQSAFVLIDNESLSILQGYVQGQSMPSHCTGCHLAIATCANQSLAIQRPQPCQRITKAFVMAPNLRSSLLQNTPCLINP